MPEISELAFDFGTLIPALVFAALAAVLPELYKFLARKFLSRIKKHIASWLHILLESYIVPIAMILRVLLACSAVTLLPFSFVHGEVFSRLLGTASGLLITVFIGLGSWQAAPVTRLLLHSAENHLDMTTNQTMGRFFENIFHALVLLFTGIAMLDQLGVPVLRSHWRRSQRFPT